MTIVRIIGQTAFDYMGFDAQDLSDMNDLADRDGPDSYWAASATFIAQMTEMDKGELKPRQINWANKIHEKLMDMRRKGKL